MVADNLLHCVLSSAIIDLREPRSFIAIETELARSKNFKCKTLQIEMNFYTLLIEIKVYMSQTDRDECLYATGRDES